MGYTLNQIKKSFNPGADDTSFIYRFFIRPLSFYLTFFLLNLGMRKPNQATFLGLLFGIVSIVFFITERRFFSLGVIFYTFFLLLDFVDGNIARVTNSATYYGKFLDGIVDALVEMLLPSSIAIGLYLETSNRQHLFSGIAVGTILLFAFFIVNRASFFRRWVMMESQQDTNREDINPNSLMSKSIPVKKIGNILTDIKIVLLFTMAAIGTSTFLFRLFLVSIAIWALILIIVTISDSAGQLNIHRVSKWDSRLT